MFQATQPRVKKVPDAVGGKQVNGRSVFDSTRLG
jgi:hypothetical protein